MHSPAPLRSFDELSPGQEFDFGAFDMPEAEILDFARRYDPQPFHVDHAAAAASPFGGLIASGLHTLSAAFGHMLRSGMFEQVSMGGGGVDVRWPAPVRPGDRIRMTARVESLKPSRSRPEMGIAQFRYTGTREQDGAVVLTMDSTHFLRR